MTFNHNKRYLQKQLFTNTQTSPQQAQL